MRNIGVVALLLTLLLVLSSCSVKVGNMPDEPKPPATGSTPPEASVTVTTLVAGDQRNEGTKEITNSTTAFKPDTKAIFVNAEIKGLETGAKITGMLRAVEVVTADGAKVKDAEVASTDLTAPGTAVKANFNFSPPNKGWPTGTYVVKILVNGQLVETLDLLVEKPAA